MLFISTLAALLAAAHAAPTQSLDFSSYGLAPRADPSLAGYMGVFFQGGQQSVFFYTSNGNNAVSLQVRNKGKAVLKPTKGTGGVRDPSIISGGGDELNKKWYIIGTDMDKNKISWDASQRVGSRGIFIWESTDLVNWSAERLVNVEIPTAGMVWAPDAIWDSEKGQYLVHWASKFYAESDPKHTGSPGVTKIRYSHTPDFKTFSAPQDYINKSPTHVIDLNILPLGSNAYARFMKDESAKNVFTEISTNGLFGTWTRPGGANAIIAKHVEGPAAYWDNQVAGKAHLLLDNYGGDGYGPYETTDVKSGKWKGSDRAGFPKDLSHGSVLPVNAAVLAALKAKYP